MRSDLGDELFAGVVERGGVRAATSDEAWIAGMLRAEAALGSLSGIPSEVIAGARIDVAAVVRDTPLGGNPVIPLVSQLRAAVPAEYSDRVHLGATSQDILDTALMLIARDSIELIVTDLVGAGSAVQQLIAAFGAVPMTGRTLMQKALPITFGDKLRVWERGLDGAVERLRAICLPAQLGGPVGTFTDLTESYAAELGLYAAPSWHTIRWPIADIAGVLAGTCGVVAKIAGDVVLMSQQEVGEVSEGTPGRGGSSSMAHKHNSVAAISASASARRAPGLAATLFAAMIQEHERAAGAWHAEWMTMVDLLRCTGSAASWLSDCLGSLQVDTDAMGRNL